MANATKAKKLKNRVGQYFAFKSSHTPKVAKMVENDAYCNDVLVQLSAVKNSVKSLSSYILENHLYTCVTRDLENGELDTIDELISLFKRFMISNNRSLMTKIRNHLFN